MIKIINKHSGRVIENATLISAPMYSGGAFLFGTDAGPVSSTHWDVVQAPALHKGHYATDTQGHRVQITSDPVDGVVIVSWRSSICLERLSDLKPCN